MTPDLRFALEGWRGRREVSTLIPNYLGPFLMTRQVFVPVIILESRNQDVLGDLNLYRGIEIAERALETVDVNNDEYFGFTLDGKRLRLTTEGEVVKIQIVESSDDCSRVVRKLLEDQAGLVAEAGMRRDKKSEIPDFKSLTNTELADFIGYSR